MKTYIHTFPVYLCKAMDHHLFQAICERRFYRVFLLMALRITIINMNNMRILFIICS